MLLPSEHLQKKFNIAICYINEHFGKVINITQLKGLSNCNYLIKYATKDLKTNLLVLKVLNLNSITENNSFVHKELENLGICPKTLINKFPYYYLTEYIPGKHPDNNYFNNTNNLEAFCKLLFKLYTIPHNHNYNNIDFIQTNSNLLKQVNSNEPYINQLNSQLMHLAKSISILPKNLAFCHNDLNNQNIIVDNNKLWLIDFEYSGISDIFFDLSSIKKLFSKQYYKKLLEYFHKELLTNLSIEQIENKLNIYSFLCAITETIWYLYMSKTLKKPYNRPYELEFIHLLEKLNNRSKI